VISSISNKSPENSPISRVRALSSVHGCWIGRKRNQPALAVGSWRNSLLFGVGRTPAQTHGSNWAGEFRGLVRLLHRYCIWRSPVSTTCFRFKVMGRRGVALQDGQDEYAVRYRSLCIPSLRALTYPRFSWWIAFKLRIYAICKHTRVLLAQHYTYCTDDNAWVMLESAESYESMTFLQPSHWERSEPRKVMLVLSSRLVIRLAEISLSSRPNEIMLRKLFRGEIYTQ
jgi:hypothetical protein